MAEQLSSSVQDLIQGTITEIDDEIARLTRMRTALAAVSGRPRPRRRRVATPRPTRATASARSAGPGAIEQVAEVLARAGRTTQAEITKETRLNSGTVSHALKALSNERPSRAATTGRKVGRSPEWAWRGERSELRQAS